MMAEHGMRAAAIIREIDWTYRTSLLRRLKINFNFHFHLPNSMLRQNQDSTTAGDPSSEYLVTTAVRIHRGFCWCDDIREAVGEAIAGTLLDVDERQELVELVLAEVQEKLRYDVVIPEYGVFEVDFNIQVENTNFYDDHHMVPAADSSIGLLEECEVEAEEGGVMICCICIEDLSAGTAASRMPCSHVFHGGCIIKWLKTSHYCPLCRYDMK